MAAFFPGATGFRTDTLVFSSLRPQIIARLGPGVPLRENALRIYPVFNQSIRVGTVLVHSAAGEHGAIECVVALAPSHQILGVRLQRLREPPIVVKALTSPLWLRAFKGKTADDKWQVGRDVPAVPPAAEPSAKAVAGAVRVLLIEHQIASDAAAKATHRK